MNDTTPNPQERLLTQLATIPAAQLDHNGLDWFPPVDIVEDAGEYLFKIDLPGVKAEALEVALEGDGLVISGERSDPWPDQTVRLRVERPHGHFERGFALPDDADRAEISTLFAESILEVHVPKVRAALPAPAPTSASPRLRLRATS